MREVAEKIYIISPYGLGDIMILCGLKDKIEDKFKQKVVFIIKKSQKIVMKMYGITDYILYDFSKEEVNAIGDKASRGDISTGECFIARPGINEKNSLFLSFLNKEIRFTEMYTKALGLNENVDLKYPIWYPAITDDLIAKLPDKVENITLVMPEMNAPSVDTVPLQYYEELFDDSDKTIVVNMINPQGKLASKCIDFSLEELLALSLGCKKVISSRSGFCDLLYPTNSNLTVVYPNHYFWDLYCFENVFGHIEKNVKEVILNYNNFFKNNGVQSCALWGLGFVGKRIISELEMADVHIEYIVDKNAENILTSYKKILPDEEFPNVDIMIITPEKDHEEISNLVEKRGIRSIFYKDLIISGEIFNG